MQHTQGSGVYSPPNLLFNPTELIINSKQTTVKKGKSGSGQNITCGIYCLHVTLFQGVNV